MSAFICRVAMRKKLARFWYCLDYAEYIESGNSRMLAMWTPLWQSCLLKIHCGSPDMCYCLKWPDLPRKRNSRFIWIATCLENSLCTDYGRPVRKSPSLHGRKSNPNPKFIGTAEAYFVCHIGPKFQISLNYAFIGCP